MKRRAHPIREYCSLLLTCSFGESDSNICQNPEITDEEASVCLFLDFSVLLFQKLRQDGPT
jgi:hypothetical protein